MDHFAQVLPPTFLFVLSSQASLDLFDSSSAPASEVLPHLILVAGRPNVSPLTRLHLDIAASRRSLIPPVSTCASARAVGGTSSVPCTSGPRSKPDQAV